MNVPTDEFLSLISQMNFPGQMHQVHGLLRPVVPANSFAEQLQEEKAGFKQGIQKDLLLKKQTKDSDERRKNTGRWNKVAGSSIAPKNLVMYWPWRRRIQIHFSPMVP